MTTKAVPLVERLQIAGYVAPRLRSGAFPRKIKVLDASGVVTREITGEDLGKALLKRVDIECSAPVPPTVCPECGGTKLARSQRCRGCADRHAKLGLKYGDEARAKMAAAKIGRRASDETKARMSEAQRRRGPEATKKAVDAVRGRRRSASAVAKGVATRRAAAANRRGEK